jgi:CRP-like cAMP-binding protein
MAAAANLFRRDHPQGTILIGEGQRLDNPLQLVGGWAALAQNSAKDAPQIAGLYLPGDIIGLGHSAAETAFCAIVALTEVSLAKPQMDEDGFETLARQQEHLVRQALRTAHKPAKARTADLLLEIYFRLKNAGLADGASFQLPLTQQVFASALGMSTVHLNRTLMQLERENLITRSNGQHITLPDIDRLAEAADFRPLRPRSLSAQGFVEEPRPPSATSLR